MEKVVLLCDPTKNLVFLFELVRILLHYYFSTSKQRGVKKKNKPNPKREPKPLLLNRQTEMLQGKKLPDCHLKHLNTQGLGEMSCSSLHDH